MPTYDYECRSCGHSEEVFQSITDDALTTCPACGKGEFRRLISAGVGIIFKGSGFYTTDSKKSGDGSTKEASKSSDSSTSSDSSSTAKGTSSDKGASEKKSEPSKSSEKAS